MTVLLVSLLCLVLLLAALLAQCAWSAVRHRRADQQRTLERALVVQAADAQLRALSHQAISAMLHTAANAVRGRSDV